MTEILKVIKWQSHFFLSFSNRLNTSFFNLKKLLSLKVIENALQTSFNLPTSIISYSFFNFQLQFQTISANRLFICLKIRKFTVHSLIRFIHVCMNWIIDRLTNRCENGAINFISFSIYSIFPLLYLSDVSCKIEIMLINWLCDYWFSDVMRKYNVLLPVSYC